MDAIVRRRWHAAHTDSLALARARHDAGFGGVSCIVGPFLGDAARIVAALFLMDGRLPVKTWLESTGDSAGAPKS